MSADVINLRRARKAAARKAGEAKAEANRALHGLPKRERERAAALTHLDQKQLDGRRRQPAPDVEG